MKAPNFTSRPIFLPFFLLLLLALSLSSSVNSQVGDSCSSNLNTNGQLPFDTSSLTCFPVWSSQGFILRYSQAAPSLWSFVLSAPNTNGFVAMGFSPTGGMVGSSAIVGWVAGDGSATMKRYFLGGQTPDQVMVDQGNLPLLGNTSSIIAESSRIYMAFQLNIDQPEKRLVFSAGQGGFLPSATNNFRLTQHIDRIAITLNYASGQSTKTKAPYSKLRRSHGILNMLGWGILVPIGVMIARYLKHLDPLWFYAHASVQTLGFILGLSGMISGLILNNRLNNNVNKHRGLGIFILALGCLQVVAFLARPNKDSKVRKYWNWYHYTVGRILIVLAVVNVFYGIHLGKAGSQWNVGYGISIAVLSIIVVILELKILLKK